MDTRQRSTLGQRTYDDFIPQHRLVQEERAETLIIELQGFRKEQIKVQIDKYGKLRISGERPLVDNRWSRFQKEYQVPDNCNASAIRAKFENESLQIVLPKLVTSAQEQEAMQEVTEPSLPPNDGKPRAGPELTSQKTILRTTDNSYDNGSKQQDAKVGEPTQAAAAAENARKAEEKEKDPVKETKDTGKSEDGDRKTEMTDSGEEKQAVTAQGDFCTGGLKYGTQGMFGGSAGSYWRRQTMLRMSVAVLVLVGMMFYATYKLKNAYTYREVEDDCNF